MGRRPKPTALKILAGNPGKRPLPKSEPRPSTGALIKPKHLSKVAAQEYDRIAGQLDKLGLLTNSDMVAFSAYCEAFALYCMAKQVVNKKGMTYEHNGLMKKRPEVSIMAEQSRIMRQFLMEFGLSPSSRAKVSSQISDTLRQPTLPNVDGTSRDPNKPTLPVVGAPAAELTDDDYFSVTVN